MVALQSWMMERASASRRVESYGLKLFTFEENTLSMYKQLNGFLNRMNKLGDVNFLTGLLMALA